ncbi:hypothetical protein BM221_006565 [Beauveria bassiana]|uniref:Uncharacterized protein n=1 Tax=Beauveria bassiana TaxID=176275 RepID=A0A2N6NHZ3_BEABA|nr:hypothetical protein BM221_006565 [Beauveria bassiana]
MSKVKTASISEHARRQRMRDDSGCETTAMARRQRWRDDSGALEALDRWSPSQIQHQRDGFL